MPRTIITLPKRLIPLAEGAAYAGVSKATIRNWIAAGVIGGYRRGPKLMFVSADEIDQATKSVTVR
jgi:excisionase family DNA binding protein